MKPIRLQRRRAKGFRLPENTVCVDRTSKWGNPFVVGEFGTKDECIDAHKKLLSGFVCATDKPTMFTQRKYYKFVKNNIEKLKLKNLACFCKEGEICHADVLLKIANQ